MNRVVMVTAHPRPGSYGRSLADHLAELVRRDHELFLHDLYEDGFDPVLTADEALAVHESITSPSLDPLVERYRRELEQADVLVAVHPNWWGKPPAMLCGWLDRVLAPGVAYKLENGIASEPRPALELRALVVTTGDTPEDREQAEFGDPLDAIWRRCVLPFIGASDITRIHVVPVNGVTRSERQERIVECTTALGSILGRTATSRGARTP